MVFESVKQKLNFKIEMKEIKDFGVLGTSFTLHILSRLECNAKFR